MVWMGLPSSTFLAVLLFWGGWHLGPVVVFETVVVLWSVKIFARPPIPWRSPGIFIIQTGIDTRGLAETPLQAKIRAVLSEGGNRLRAGMICLSGIALAPVVVAVGALVHGTSIPLVHEGGASEEYSVAAVGGVLTALTFSAFALRSLVTQVRLETTPIESSEPPLARPDRQAEDVTRIQHAFAVRGISSRLAILLTIAAVLAMGTCRILVRRGLGR